jgi:pyridoxamine 5'-phosphate oxidase family protein
MEMMMRDIDNVTGGSGIMSNSVFMFSEKEVEYLRSQHLARIATSSPDGIQDVAPVGFDFDGSFFYIGGMNITKTTKYRNIMKNNNIALVIDDLKTINPWDPRGIKIYGTAEIVTRDLPGGQIRDNDHFRPTYIRIRPVKKWAWGIDEPVFQGGRFNVKRASTLKQ